MRIISGEKIRPQKKCSKKRYHVDRPNGPANRKLYWRSFARNGGRWGRQGFDSCHHSTRPVSSPSPHPSSSVILFLLGEGSFFHSTSRPNTSYPSSLRSVPGAIAIPESDRNEPRNPRANTREYHKKLHTRVGLSCQNTLLPICRNKTSCWVKRERKVQPKTQLARETHTTHPHDLAVTPPQLHFPNKKRERKPLPRPQLLRPNFDPSTST